MMQPVPGAGLLVVTPSPLNAETPLGHQPGLITPVGSHYVRNHFAVPEHPGVLEIDGGLRRPLTLGLEELRERRAETILVTLECAGNGRRFLQPPVKGEQWGLGAVGTAEWTGVRLGALLEAAGVMDGAVEVLFAGADSGTPAALDHAIAFERSLPLDAARDALVAYDMNGQPLPPDHGAPFRLIVPGRYGMASVKWLRRISLVTEPFRGFFQADRYVVDGLPLGRIAPRAVITRPSDGDTIRGGRSVVRGFAWSGRGPVTAVEISDDGGASWRTASLGAALSPVAWRSFEIGLDAPRTGPAELLARAIDTSGVRQPLEQNWNSLGYMNNAVRPVRVEIMPADA